MGDISEGAPRELGPRRDARQAAVLAKSSDHYGVPRGVNPGCVAPRDHRMTGAGPQPCGTGAGEASLGHFGRVGGEATAQSWLRATLLHGRCCACSTWAWARGGPASLGRRCRHARVRRRGGGRLASRSSSSWSSLPRMREMSLLLCLPGSRRSERRSANIDDAALVEECVETWEGGAAMRGQEGKVSSPLRSRHPSVAPDALCPSAYAYEWDSRVSLTP